MTCKDLMLGDLVTFKDCQYDEKPSVIKIWQINGDGHALAFIDSDKALDEIAIDDEVVGIPIMPEFLEKNGFKVYQHGSGFMFILADDYYDITAREFNDGLWEVEYDCTEMGGIPTQNVNISFVHELQHFFRLCGVDIEITL